MRIIYPTHALLLPPRTPPHASTCLCCVASGGASHTKHKQTRTHHIAAALRSTTCQDYLFTSQHTHTVHLLHRLPYSTRLVGTNAMRGNADLPQRSNNNAKRAGRVLSANTQHITTQQHKRIQHSTASSAGQQGVKGRELLSLACAELQMPANAGLAQTRNTHTAASCQVWLQHTNAAFTTPVCIQEAQVQSRAGGKGSQQQLNKSEQGRKKHRCVVWERRLTPVNQASMAKWQPG